MKRDMDMDMELHRKYDVASQQLVNLKWWLTELAKHSSDTYVRTQLTLLAGDTRKVIDNLLAPDEKEQAFDQCEQENGKGARV